MKYQKMMRGLTPCLELDKEDPILLCLTEEQIKINALFELGKITEKVDMTTGKWVTRSHDEISELLNRVMDEIIANTKEMCAYRILAPSA